MAINPIAITETFPDLILLSITLRVIDNTLITGIRAPVSLHTVLWMR